MTEKQYVLVCKTCKWAAVYTELSEMKYRRNIHAGINGYHEMRYVSI